MVLWYGLKKHNPMLFEAMQSWVWWVLGGWTAWESGGNAASLLQDGLCLYLWHALVWSALWWCSHSTAGPHCKHNTPSDTILERQPIPSALWLRGSEHKRGNWLASASLYFNAIKIHGFSSPTGRLASALSPLAVELGKRRKPEGVYANIPINNFTRGHID